MNGVEIDLVILGIIFILGLGSLSIIWGAIFSDGFRMIIFAAQGQISYLGFTVTGVVFLVLEACFIFALVSIGDTYLESKLTNIETLVLEKRQVEKSNKSLQNILDKSRTDVVKRTNDLLAAQEQIVALKSATESTEKVNSRITDELKKNRELREEITRLNNANTKYLAQINGNRNYIFSDVIARRIDTKIPETSYGMRLVNVGNFSKKMQLSFFGGDEGSVPDDIYMVMGEVKDVTLGQEKFRFKMLGANISPENVGLVIERL